MEDAEQQQVTNKNDTLVAAISCGFPISFSSCADINHTFPRIHDQQMNHLPEGWSAKSNVPGEWCQVCLINERVVREIEMTGRRSSGCTQFVKSFIIKYTSNGIDWTSYNGGEVINGPQSVNEIVRHRLIPFKAISVRIYPQDFHSHMSCRWELYFQKD